MTFIFAVLFGLLTGVISAWGVGGGTLLVICMTVFGGVEQRTAQGINLFYFIPVSLAALVSHIKNKLIAWRAVFPAVIAGVPAAAIMAFAASHIETLLLRKIFGGFILAVGLFEMFAKPQNDG